MSWKCGFTYNTNKLKPVIKTTCHTMKLINGFSSSSERSSGSCIACSLLQRKLPWQWQYIVQARFAETHPQALVLLVFFSCSTSTADYPRDEIWCMLLCSWDCNRLQGLSFFNPLPTIFNEICIWCFLKSSLPDRRVKMGSLYIFPEGLWCWGQRAKLWYFS